MILPPSCQRVHVRACQLAPDLAYDQQVCARVEPLTFYLPEKTPERGQGYTLEKTPLTCGAPLRNRTVDLLLTITTISQPKDRYIRPDQAER